MIKSLPLISISKSCILGYTQPIFTFKSSAVLSPIAILCFFFIYFTIASSNLSPATFIELLTTDPPNDITAISVVPPPISTTMFPHGFAISIPAPIAAAIGSSIKYTLLAPAWVAASITAFFSTSVTCEGIQIIILGANTNFPHTLFIKYFNIFSVTV